MPDIVKHLIEWIGKESVLIYWGRVTHICVNKLTVIGSDNGLAPTIRTNAGILLTGTLEIYFNTSMKF